jgi:hypothetical protein
MKLPTPDDTRRLAEVDAEMAKLESSLLAKARATPYADPADANPRPPVKDLDLVWVDDEAPSGWNTGTSSGGSTRWVTNDDGCVV